MLRRVADELWETTVPQRFLSFEVGTRMTVVRLPGGGLLLYSPVPIDSQLRQEIDALGPVRHVVCPNLYHHLYAGPAKALYPDAILWAPRRLARKRPDLSIDRDLDDRSGPAWADTIALVTIRGCALGETVLYHRPSRTLLSSDLVEYFERCDDLWTRMYLRASGLYRKVGWNRLMRFVYRDRKAARASIDRILDWDFDRAVIAHGEILTRSARDAISAAFAWLR